MDSDNPIIGLLLLVLIILVKATVSNVKAAINYINEAEVKKRAEEGDKDSVLLIELLAKPEFYIFAIDIVITALSVFSGVIYIRYFSAWVIQLADKIVSGSVALRMIFTVIALFLLIEIISLFGSLLPKKIAKKNAEKRAYNTVNLMKIIVTFLRPITWLMQIIMNGLIKLFGIDPKELLDNVTEEGIISMVNEGQEQGLLEANEVEMISNIIEFDEKEVEDIMTHRNKIVGVNADMTIDEAMRYMVEEKYSRYPLFEGDLDNITGIVHIKDVTNYYVNNINNDIKTKKISEIAKKAYFVPESQKIDVLFNDMKSKKIHMAVAVDEYGQTSGIVAFEDVIEEIVGNILDEYDIDEKNIIRQANGQYIMRGASELDEVSDILGIDLENDEYDTLNGFLISKLDRIPKDGEKMTLKHEGYVFEVLDTRNKMIKFVRVKKDLDISKEVVEA